MYVYSKGRLIPSVNGKTKVNKYDRRFIRNAISAQQKMTVMHMLSVLYVWWNKLAIMWLHVVLSAWMAGLLVTFKLQNFQIPNWYFGPKNYPVKWPKNVYINAGRTIKKLTV